MRCLNNAVPKYLIELKLEISIPRSQKLTIIVCIDVHTVVFSVRSRVTSMVQESVRAVAPRNAGILLVREVAVAVAASLSQGSLSILVSLESKSLAAL